MCTFDVLINMLKYVMWILGLEKEGSAFREIRKRSTPFSIQNNFRTFS